MKFNRIALATIFACSTAQASITHEGAIELCATKFLSDVTVNSWHHAGHADDTELLTALTFQGLKETEYFGGLEDYKLQLLAESITEQSMGEAKAYEPGYLNDRVDQYIDNCVMSLAFQP